MSQTTKIFIFQYCVKELHGWYLGHPELPSTSLEQAYNTNALTLYSKHKIYTNLLLLHKAFRFIHWSSYLDFVKLTSGGGGAGSETSNSVLTLALIFILACKHWMNSSLLMITNISFSYDFK